LRQQGGHSLAEGFRGYDFNIWAVAKYVLEDLVLLGVWDLKNKAAVRANALHLLWMPLLPGNPACGLR